MKQINFLFFVRSVLLVTILLFVLLLQGCASLDYYVQSIKGQMEIFASRESIDDLLASNSLSPEFREKLSLVKSLREFAINELHLPANKSYTTYSDIGRDYVVWNVFATPEFSLEPMQWCYPIAGCLDYRGFFSLKTANDFARSLEEQKKDVYVGGVRAYSTLGWFSDPVLNTIIDKKPAYIARIIFHELAHQKIFITGDTDFNEAFAETVALEGTTRWLEKMSNKDQLESFNVEQQRENRFVELVLEYRKQLEELYQGQMTTEQMLIEKNRLFLDMLHDYESLRRNWDDKFNYDTWFTTGINNAKLAAISTYRQLVPGFLNLLAMVDYQLTDFYRVASSLQACPKKLRHDILMDIDARKTPDQIDKYCTHSG